MTVERVLDEETARRIKVECGSGDIEGDHSRADDILIQVLRTLGYGQTVEAWQAVKKWYA